MSIRRSSEAAGPNAKVFASYAEFYREVYGHAIDCTGTVGSGGGYWLQAMQEAGDWSDEPTPDLLVCFVSQGLTSRAVMDLGVGRFDCTMEPGDAIVVAPETRTSILMDSRHGALVFAVPYRNLLAYAGAESGLPERGDFGALHARKLRDRELFALMRRMAVQRTRREALYEDGLILQFVGMLVRRWRGASLPQRGGLAPWQERRVVERLRDGLADQITLAELAALVDLSPFHFNRAFKQATGVPPFAYQRQLRCERAQELLEATQLGVTEIALEVGYDSSQALTRMFRAQTGTTPSRYRRDRRA